MPSDPASDARQTEHVPSRWRYGFTGTRKGMTPAQQELFAKIVHIKQPCEFHHGDCVGADDEAQAIVRVAVKACRFIGWPGPLSAMTANCPCDVKHPPKDYLARNRDIVNATDALIAAPPSNPAPYKSGTSSTIRYATQQGKPLLIMWPDGTYEYRNAYGAQLVGRGVRD